HVSVFSRGRASARYGRGWASASRSVRPALNRRRFPAVLVPPLMSTVPAREFGSLRVRSTSVLRDLLEDGEASAAAGSDAVAADFGAGAHAPRTSAIAATPRSRR